MEQARLDQSIFSDTPLYIWGRQLLRLELKGLQRDGEIISNQAFLTWPFFLSLRNRLREGLLSLAPPLPASLASIQTFPAKALEASFFELKF